MERSRRAAFAIAAHPDDIEFMMAGTLILLGQAGYELHYMNVANGSCGTATLSLEEIVAIRTEEAKAAAGLIGAVYHPGFVNDIDIFYDKSLLAQVGAVIRQVNPTIVLAPSPQDYMEDHAITSRLVVSATFCRTMRNFPTAPPADPVADDVAIYHALPYGLRDGLRRRVPGGHYVDITPVMGLKREMLATHKSQKEWLDRSQGLDAYLATMEDICREVGTMSGRFQYAEGWRRHSHLGFSGPDFDPLIQALGERVIVDQDYERELEGPFAT